MATGRKPLVLLVAGWAAVALCCVLWFANRNPRQTAAPVVPSMGEAREDQTRTEASRVAVESAPRSREPDLPPHVEPSKTVADARASEPAVRQQGESWRAVKAVLDDQEFLDACERA